MNILGISGFYHDAAACIVQDGNVVAAASEERFNRRKNSPDFPINAINFCIQKAGLTAFDLDYVGFYEKPFLKFYRVLLSHLRSYPFSFPNFYNVLPGWLEERLVFPLIVKKELGYEKEVLFVKHHLSHAASSFLVSPFEEAAILTGDGVGEWAAMSAGVGRGTDIKITKELHFPSSLGLVYTAVTTFLGFEALQGEGKIMGLAGFGKPKYLDEFKKMVIVKPDGSFMVDQRFFGLNKGSRMYESRIKKIFGMPRVPGEKIEERHCDIAASLQKFTEDTLLAIVDNLHSETKLDKLCLAGGLFLNCVANGKILENSRFKEVFIQPAAGDSGGALGVAAYIYHSILGNKRSYVMKDAYLGPDFSMKQAKQALTSKGIDFKELSDEELCRSVAQHISQGKIVGWVQGRMEFGPRALGNRSILADPRNPGMKDILNSKVKKRESFRPYAPVVLEERVGEYFDIKQLSPFMLLSGNVRDDKVNVIPSVTHVDKTARIQTVDRQTNPKLRMLLQEFEKITGVPVLINTSFNLRGEPIVCSPEDAVSCFQRTNMDCLVLGNIVAVK